MYRGTSKIKYYERKLRHTKDKKQTKTFTTLPNRNDKKNPSVSAFEFNKKPPVHLLLS